MPHLRRRQSSRPTARCSLKTGGLAASMRIALISKHLLDISSSRSSDSRGVCVARQICEREELPSPKIVPPNNPVDLQSLKLIDFQWLRWLAQQRLFTVLGALT